MKIQEQFLREYQAQVLDDLMLPPYLRTQYSVLSCLKDGERQVYLIRDQEGWPAVLKVQPAGRKDALRQEYHLLQKLRHPQIPRPLSYLEWQGKEYLIREYVEGISLYEYVRSQGPFSSSKIQSLTLSLCQVLHYLHSQQPPIICRDLKPQNVILDPSGCCHLIDLGAARHHQPEKQEDTVFLGTQATAPPQQFGYQQTDQRSDIYSLGMLIWILRIGQYDPPTADGGLGFLDRVIRRCTAFDPQNRYSSIRSLYRALKYRWLRRVISAAIVVTCTAVIITLFHTSAPESHPSSSLLEDAQRQELQLDSQTSYWCADRH